MTIDKKCIFTIHSDNNSTSTIKEGCHSQCFIHHDFTEQGLISVPDLNHAISTGNGKTIRTRFAVPLHLIIVFFAILLVRFLFSFSSIENIYQILETVFHHISKHLLRDFGNIK